MANKHQETGSEAKEEMPEPPVSAAPEIESNGVQEPAASDVESPVVEEEIDIKHKKDKESERIAALEGELATLREELSSVNDKYLRKLADDVNFRKRMAREKEEGQRFALTGLLGDLIPVLDDFDRAIASAETQRDYIVLHDGVTLIRRQLGLVLENKYGLVKITSLGQAFDPNKHEAVAMVQGGPDDGEEAVVAEEFLPGYGLHERIIRTAKVKVRMPAPKAQADTEGEQDKVPGADKDAK